MSKAEQQELDKLLRGGLQPVQTVLRAMPLRQLADRQALRAVAHKVGLTPKTVWLTSQRYQQGGLERALYERPRPGKEARLDAQQRQRLVALVCSPPPEGWARWTVRLLAEEALHTAWAVGLLDHSWEVPTGACQSEGQLRRCPRRATRSYWRLDSLRVNIRNGRRRPHPRHWQALAELVGKSPTHTQNPVNEV